MQRGIVRETPIYDSERIRPRRPVPLAVLTEDPLSEPRLPLRRRGLGPALSY